MQSNRPSKVANSGGHRSGRAGWEAHHAASRHDVLVDLDAALPHPMAHQAYSESLCCGGARGHRRSKGAGKTARLASGSLCGLHHMWWCAVVSGGASGCRHRAAVVLTLQAIHLCYTNDTLFGSSLRSPTCRTAIRCARGARGRRTARSHVPETRAAPRAGRIDLAGA